MEKINLTIDGIPVNVIQGATILDAAKEYGISIPTLCNHPHLKPAGACRICIVEEETSGRIFASCVTPAASNMSIRTDTPLIRQYRSDIVRLMIANHPESCILCDKGNRCELRGIASDLGIGDIDLYPMPYFRGLEAANPFIIRDLSKCILCGRCIRSDHEMVVVGAIDYNLRGLKSRPATVHDLPLDESNCTFCGTCVSMCPTGALMIKNTGHPGSPQKESSTICGFCGVGCKIVMGSVNERIVEVNPSHETNTANQSTLCVRGHFAHDYLVSSERLKSPLIRKEKGLEPISWDEALSFVSERLLTIKKENGPQSIGFMGSSKCSNEENYLFQKMARQVLETHNIDNSGYLSSAPIVNSMGKRLGNGERIKSLKELEGAEIIFIVGTDPAQTVPVAGYHIRRASKFGQTPIILAYSRKTELVPFSSIWLQIKPGSDLHLINSLSASIVRKKSYNREFVGEFTEDFRIFTERIKDFDLDKSCRITGIDSESIDKVISLMNGKKTAFLVGEEITMGPEGESAIDSLINLALLTGSIGSSGCGIYFVTKENNQAGAVDMGAVPDMFPGRGALGDPDIRKYWGKKFEKNISPDSGLDMIRMILEAEKGNLKALYIMGENPVRSMPQSQQVKKSLQNLELLIVQDILLTETAEMADVVLPGAAFSEKSGSFTNMEGRIQLFDPVVNPPGDAKPDWEILDRLMEKTGEIKRYESINRIRNEISSNVPMYAGLSDSRSETWVNVDEEIKIFNKNKEGRLISFIPVNVAAEESFNSNYPFKTILSPIRYHLGSGTRTNFSKRINDFFKKGVAEISPADSRRLGLEETDTVEISSLYGSIKREIRINEGLKEGTLSIPLAFNNNDVMNLLDLNISNSGRPVSRNVCDVKIEKV